LGTIALRLPGIKAAIDRWRTSGIEQKSGIASPEPWFYELFGACPTTSGPAITPQSAMHVPAVAAAVSLISTTVGTLPAKVFARDDKGGKAPDGDHPAYALVHDEANPWTSASALREQLTADALLHDAGYAWANRVNGRAVELIRLDPTQTSVEADALTGEPRYVSRGNGGTRVYPYSDVVHIPAFGGCAPIKLAREAIGLALVLEQHAARLFGRGARPSGVLKFPEKLDGETAARIRDSWHAAHAGETSGRTAVLEQGGEFQSLTFKSVDAQFAEMRAFQIVEIARAFRTPPTMLGDLSRGTWSNVEQLNLQFLQLTLLPWLRTWEAAYRRVLLSPAERETFTVEFVVDDLLRSDTASRAEAYAKFRAMGVMTANEVRARENLPAIEGGDSLASPFTTSNTGAAA
jgi:HK97 family phage portal protein